MPTTHAVIWTNNGLVYWCIYLSLGLNEYVNSTNDTNLEPQHNKIFWQILIFISIYYQNRPVAQIPQCTTLMPHDGYLPDALWDLWAGSIRHQNGSDCWNSLSRKNTTWHQFKFKSMPANDLAKPEESAGVALTYLALSILLTASCIVRLSTDIVLTL